MLNVDLLDAATVTATISLDDGTCAVARLPDGARELGQPRRVKWREEHLAAAISLAPGVLGLAGAKLISRVTHGTQMAADMMYRDPVGRIHVIELKNEEAGLQAVAQVLSYGDIFRTIREEDLFYGRAGLDAEENPEHCLAVLRDWAESRTKRKARSSGPATAPLSAPLRMLPPRHILIAPDFSPDVLPMVEELTKRGTSLELWQAKLRAAADEVELRLGAVHRREHIERTWRGFDLAWASEVVRKTFDFVGFADLGTNRTFSLALKDDPRVCVWLLAFDDEPRLVWMAAWPPDKYGSRAERSRIVRQLEACPEQSLRDDGWLWWKLRLDKPAAATRTAAAVARVVQDAFAPGGVPTVPAEPW